MKAAQSALTNRKALLAAAARAIEEGTTNGSLVPSMQVLGITGVEDSLAPQVPQTIALLQRAGMALWVLTGDKLVSGGGTGSFEERLAL
jgi:P-type E1-E2 ATPase